MTEVVTRKQDGGKKPIYMQPRHHPASSRPYSPFFYFG